MRLIAVLLMVASTAYCFVTSRARAQCSDQACVSVEGSIANVSTSDSAVLDALFNSLLGTGSAIDLTLGQHQTLASATVEVSDVLASLNLLGVGSTADGALAAAAPITTQLQAIANAARASGDTAVANALDVLRAQASTAGATQIKLGDVVQLDARTLNQSARKLNVLDLLNAEFSRFNVAKNVTSGTTTLAGSTLGLDASITGVQLSVVVLEPGKFVCGPSGTQFYGASMRVRAHVSLLGSNAPLAIPGLLSAQINLTTLDIVAAVGRASGTIDAVNDILGTIRVSATPGIADLYLGAINDANFFDRSTPIDPVTELTPGTVASVTLNVLFLSVNVAVMVKSYASASALAPSTLNFTGPYPQTLVGSASAGAVSNLVDTLLGNLQVTLGEPSGTLGLVTSVLNGILGDTLTLVTSLLKSSNGLLGAPLRAVLTGPVDSLLGGLGVKLGQVSVRAEAPFPVLPGATCNDTAYCTINDVCDGNGVCAGTARDCSDALTCTTDACNEATDACTHALVATSCQIGGACVPDGAAQPGNACMVCRPTQSQTAYVPASAGTSCSDGLFCTVGDACNALGACLGAPNSCSDGLGCTLDVCNELSDVCASTPLASCVINGACVAAGSDDPTNPCATCNPLVSTTSYSPKVGGTPCDDGQYCTVLDACNAGVCTGAARDCADLLGCTSDVCNETSDQCVHTISTGCAINGLCIPAGVDDPLNPCMTCNPAVATTAFSPKSAGTACDDAQFCTSNDVCSVSGTCGGSPRSCSDGLSCTSDTCNETLDLCVSTPTTGCLIGGACVPSGATDPANACLGCNPSVSSVAYTPRAAGASCDDGLFCTTSDACNGLGGCAGTARSCSDGLACTTDVCNELSDACVNTPVLSCTIGGACVAAGADDPTNACRACNPLVSTTAYTAKVAGALCDDGLFCTAVDTCNGSGVCGGTARSCADLLACTTDSCDEANDTCVNTQASGCTILGACVAAGATDPLNPCLACNPAVSTIAYTPKTAGTSCDDGLYCTTTDACNALGVCTGAARTCSDGLNCTTDVCNELTDQCVNTPVLGCTINGSCVAPGSDDPGNSCNTCNPLVSTSAYVAKLAGAACDDGQYCTTGDACNGSGTCAGTARDCNDLLGCTNDGCSELTDQCVHAVNSGGCAIGLLCLAAGAIDPLNPCMACNPASSTTAYTPRTAGTACDDGQYCTTGDSCNPSGVCGGAARACGDGLSCTSDSCNELLDVCVNTPAIGCTIGGACVASGAADPANPCLACNPGVSALAYTPRAAGAACDDGLFCTTSDACNGLGVCGGSLRTCSDGLACTTDVCNELSDVCVSTPVLSCTIGGACIPAGSDDPSNGCRTCDPAVSTTGYSPKVAGSLCDDGLFCTAVDTCNGSGSCTGTARACADGLSCTTDTCSESGDQCVFTLSVGCNIGGSCIPAGAIDPANACQTCNPGVSTSTWSPRAVGTSCNDGLFCTAVDTCNVLGVCTGAARGCDDGLSCTSDQCNELTDQCVSARTSGCLIGGACVPAGANDPSNACMSCVPATSTSGYTPRAAGASCDDGLFCTSADRCDGAGQCAGDVRSCDDGVACTADSCDEVANTCVSSQASGCFIHGACVPSGADDPASACRACNPQLSISAYSPKLQGTPCTDGLFCTSDDACNGLGACTGTVRSCSDGIACTADTCNEAADACNNAVSAGCVIDGACVAEGVDDPNDPCRTCTPALSTTHYSLKAVGSACSDGLYCTVGDRCSVAGTCVGELRACGAQGAGCSQACDEQSDSCVAVTSGCSVNGTCVASGTRDPENACLVCDPLRSNSAFSPVAAGTSCSDGIYCTVNDACNAEGACAGVLRSCDDGLDCTFDDCDEDAHACIHDAEINDACVIDATCVAAGASAPGNVCLLCEPAVSTTHYTTASVGSACDDGRFCTTGDACNVEGACVGASRDCGGGSACASSCDENTDTCRSDVAGCSIDGLCVADGSPDPLNPCRACNSGLNRFAYTARALGSSCDDGLYCTVDETCDIHGQCVGDARACSSGGACDQTCDEAQDTCVSGRLSCAIQGSCFAAGAQNPQNPCEVCDPARAPDSFSPRSAGSVCSDGRFCTDGDACDAYGSCVGRARSCDDGLACTSDACDELAGRCTSTLAGGCAIDGACHAAGASDPRNPCRLCQPGLSAQTWTNAPATQVCDDGLFCTGSDHCDGNGACTGGASSACGSSNGACATFCDEASDSCRADLRGCAIDGACVAAGAAHPQSPCLVCDPDRDAAAWSASLPGSACDDGLFCTEGDTCSDAGVCSGSARACNDALSCTSGACNEVLRGCDQNVLAGCAIDGSCVLAGTVDPSSPCRMCEPNLSRTSWSIVALGTQCEDGAFCTANDQCDERGVCVGGPPPCAGDSLGCTLETCDEANDLCAREVTSGCVVDDLCVPAGARKSASDACYACSPEDGKLGFTYLPDAIGCDSDRDGVRDSAELEPDGTERDTDGDGRPDQLDDDDDDDGIPTRREHADDDEDGLPDSARDSDGDGKPDYLDPDDDDDGVLTRHERTNGSDQDTDGDGVPDHLDDDDDDDGVLTRDEEPDANGDGRPDDALDSDEDGTPDYLDPDSAPENIVDENGNGIPDSEEGNALGDAAVEQDEDGGEEPAFAADAGANDDAGSATRRGGVSGSGLCSASPATGGDTAWIGWLLTLTCVVARTRRKRRDHGASATASAR